MDLFGKISPWRPLVLSGMAYLIVGYILFFMSVSMPHPSWRGTFIDYFFPMIRALNTAEKVALINGNDPFPAQLMIIYSDYGSIFLSFVGLYNMVFLKDIRNYCLEQIPKKNVTRFKLFFSGFFSILMSIFLYPGMLFSLDVKEISTNNIFHYSSSLVSATRLLFFGLAPSILISFGICAIYYSFFGKNFNK